MFSAFAVAAILGPLASKELLAMGGFPMVFRVYGLLALVSTGLTLKLYGRPESLSAARIKEMGGGLALFGGCLFHITGGTQYTLGNLIVYFPENLKYWAGAGTGIPDALEVLPITIMSQMLGMPIGPMVERRLGPKLTMLIAGTLMGSGVLISSYMTNLESFTFFYATVFGIGVGIGYQVPILTGVRWFPDKKGSVSGLITGAFGGSAFLFSLMDSSFLNPDAVNPVGGKFPASVYERFPQLVFMLGFIYGALAICGAFLQSNPLSYKGKYLECAKWVEGQTGEGDVNVQGNQPTAPKPLLEDILSRRFATMWLMILSSAICGLNIAGTFKVFAISQPQLNDDSFLVSVAMLSSLLGNMGGRFFWGAMSDFYGFGPPFIALTLTEAFFMFFFKQFSSFRSTFLLATTVMLFCLGGNFAMFPAETMRKFGPANGSLVYGFMFSAFALAAILGPFVSKILIAMGGFEAVFKVYGLLALVSTGLTLMLPNPPVQARTAAKDFQERLLFVSEE
jgi:OFA family oxalate/formate antiporter-like MFS transporter